MGEIIKHASGMKREDKAGKTDYTLAMDGPMFDRYAEHLTKGAKVHGPRNWMQANSQEELDEARASLSRHFWDYIRGEPTEDHAAAIIFNLNVIELIREKLLFAKP